MKSFSNDEDTISKCDGTVQQNIFKKKAKPINVKTKFEQKLLEFYKLKIDSSLTCLPSEWQNDLPKKWKLTNNLLILPNTCFTLSHWCEFNDDIWKILAECFKVERIAQERRVKSDDFRSPNLVLLYGNSTIVNTTNNGIKYSYDFTKCMFSWGNITEKLRIASFDCRNEIVVDLFAGK
jgi:tRNA G37 N-methylase Trm5